MTPWPEWFRSRYGLQTPDAVLREEAAWMAGHYDSTASVLSRWTAHWRREADVVMEQVRENQAKEYAGRAAELRRCLAERT